MPNFLKVFLACAVACLATLSAQAGQLPPWTPEACVDNMPITKSQVDAYMATHPTEQDRQAVLRKLADQLILVMEGLELGLGNFPWVAKVTAREKAEIDDRSLTNPVYKKYQSELKVLAEREAIFEQAVISFINFQVKEGHITEQQARQRTKEDFVKDYINVARGDHTYTCPR